MIEPVIFCLGLSPLFDAQKLFLLLGIYLEQGESRMRLPGWDGRLVTFGIGLLFTALAASYVTHLAKVTTLHSKQYN